MKKKSDYLFDYIYKTNKKALYEFLKNSSYKFTIKNDSYYELNRAFNIFLNSADNEKLELLFKNVHTDSKLFEKIYKCNKIEEQKTNDSKNEELSIQNQNDKNELNSYEHNFYEEMYNQNEDFKKERKKFIAAIKITDILLLLQITLNTLLIYATIKKLKQEGK